MKKVNFPSKNIGILGGGQLARMLCLKGHELGLPIWVLSLSQTDPAALVTQNWVKGDPNHLPDVIKFLKKVDLATFESEFLDAHMLTKASLQTKTPIKPKPKIMKVLQDRLTQKSCLERAGIPVTRFLPVSSLAMAQSAYFELTKVKRSKNKVILKKRRNGYDGYGTYVISTPTDLEKLESTWDTPGYIAEEFIPFKREIAISVARSKDNRFAVLPLVETFQKDSRCLWVKGPVTHSKIKSMTLKIKKFMNQIDYEGILAFEFFDLGKSLLLNEVAPRVHNSAHYSLDALTDDQFSIHLKAILNAPLRSPSSLKKCFAMLNLLADQKSNQPKWTFPTDISVHWYGKQALRPGRKMGHLTVSSHSSQVALNRLLKARKDFTL